MPRTFSRGDKITVAKIFDFIKFVPENQTEELLRDIRATFCEEPALEEQEIVEPLLDILEKLTLFRDHLDDFHADEPHLVNLWIPSVSNPVNELLQFVEERFKRLPVV